MNQQDLYRKIPKVDRLLEDGRISALAKQYGGEVVTDAVRSTLDDLRARIGRGEILEEQPADFADIILAVKEKAERMVEPGLKRVINATGTILHTNLGRAPVSREFAAHIAEEMTGYVNVEYDLQAGERGKRGGRCEELLTKLTGAEDALVVNNNAAAVLLILNGLCSGREVIVSRGELVEIGGHFRMPDVMSAGGCRLCEVGTTNKTRIGDYARAITPRTAALMKVHTSNFRIVGFTETVTAGEMAQLAREKNLLFIEDLGSGRLIDTEQYGLGDEPSVRQCVASGADIICFSGDKLLGGPQAGIILGKKDIVERLRNHPVMRALRPDKITLAVLEMTLLAYLNEDRALETIPVLRMASMTAGELTKKAEHLAALICESLAKDGLPSQDGTAVSRNRETEASVEPIADRLGGGALPETELEGAAVRIHLDQTAGETVRQALLSCPVPVIARYAEHDLLLSVRTIDEQDFDLLADMLAEVLS